MRKIVKRIKIMALHALAAGLRLFGFAGTYASDIPARILVISTTGIGDTIWGTPALFSLRTAYPDAFIALLTRQEWKDLFAGSSSVNEVYGWHKSAGSQFGFARMLRKQHFDTVIVFHATDRPVWMLALLSGAARIIGSPRHSKELGFVISHPVEVPHNTHAIAVRHLMVKKIGAECVSTKPRLDLDDADRIAAADMLTRRGVPKGRVIIAFQPGAAKSYKRWPEGHFVRLGRMIRQQYPEAVVVVLGGRGDAAAAKRIADGVGGISLAGELSLRNSVAVIGQSSLLVTNDTGLLHAGVALDTPTLALFAATGIENIDPYREFERFRAIAKPKTCTPCVGKKCEAGTCMEQILPEEALASARELLGVSGGKELVY